MTESFIKTKRYPLLLLVFSLLIIGAYIWVSRALPDFDHSIRESFRNLQEYAVERGLTGMFVFAIAANATILLNIPYSAATVLLAGLGVNPFLVALSAGVGAMVGEVFGYLVGLSGSALFSRKHLPRFSALRQLLERKKHLTPLLIFTFAALPIPDDILIVPLGVIRYPFLKMIVPMTLGKIIQNAYFALLGRYSIGAFDVSGQGSGFLIGLITLILLLGALQAVLWIDWDALVKRWTKAL